MMKVYQAERLACLVEACQTSDALVVLFQVGCIVGIIWNPIMMKVYQAERVACLVEACQPSEALVVLLQVGCIVGIICEPNYDEGVSGSRHTSSLTSARRSTGPQPDSASRHQHTTLLPITCSHR